MPDLLQDLKTQKSFGQKYDLKDTYIVRPYKDYGIEGLIFSVELDTSIELSSEITDHYAEDNSVINDHVAIRPVRIKLRGYMGELVSAGPNPIIEVAATISDKLTLIDTFLPNLTTGANQKLIQITAAIASVESLTNTVVDTAFNLYETFKQQSIGETTQKKVFSFLRALQKRTDKTVSVETPYSFFPNMIIESASFINIENTYNVSDITLTLKEFRTVSTFFTEFNFNKYRSSTNANRSQQVEKGAAQGVADQGLLNITSTAIRDTFNSLGISNNAKGIVDTFNSLLNKNAWLKKSLVI